MADRPTTAAIAAADARSVSPPIQIALAVVLGVAVIVAVGFAPIEVAHNAAHDYRHAMGFPCH